MIRTGCCLLLCLTFSAANQPPEFIDNMQHHIIYENTPVGDVVYTLKGVDPEGSAVYYGIRGTDHLQVDPQSGAVTVQRIIDHEVLRELKLEVTLQDRVEGGEDNVIAVPISVIVVDRNDNVPVFEKDNYEADIREDLRIGSSVIRGIRVSDLDLLGENINVTCDPAKSSPGACQLFGLVTLNSTSQLYLGSVMLRQPLSLGLSVGDQITVALMASDGVHSAWSTLSVRVQDIQNRPPVISGSSTVVVDEGATIGTIVMKMSAVDGDTVDQRPVLYELLQNPGDYFSLDEESGELTTAKRLDRESPLVKDGAIDIKLKAVEVDQGRRLRGPLTETIRQIRITIRDSNDESPRFSRQEYSASIAENVRQGTPLSDLDIVVSDPDLGQGGEFSVRLLDDSGSFSVEPTSGRGSSSLSIKLARPALDYENPNDRKFILLLVAEESSTAEKLAATSTVTVTLSDVNDNIPKFAQDAYVAQVSEKSAPGTIITTVSAEDRDSGQLGTAGIVYRLSGRGAEKFSIDQRTGTVVVALCDTPGLSPCIDFETDRHFFLNVEATDSDGLGLMSSVALKVSTLDANDNEPVLERTEYRAVIREGATGFQPPLRVTASDPDVTSQLTYTLVESGGGVFRIDPVSGEVTVNKSQGIDLSDVGTSHLQLLVEITDGVHTVSVPLDIEIQDTNNNAPQFIKSAYLSVLPESIPVGTVVERTVARDGDMDDNARLRYRLQQGSFDDFRIHPESGVVTLARRLDYERRSSYSIQILAVDSGVAPLTGTTTLSVNIINSNDKNPYFTPRTQQTEVSEDAAVGSVFYQLAAADPDVASPDRLFFTLDGSIAAVGVDGTRVERPDAAYQGFFNVSGDGRVRVAAPLSRQTAAVVTLRVRVTDTSAVPPQSSIGRLLVSIVDVNDHSPEFAAPWSRDRPVLNYSVREELAVGTVFARLEATDRDTRVQRYSADNNSYIGVHPDTGAMILLSRVDFENITEIRLNVTAFDSGVPQKNATALVVVEVINVNDETPVFSQDVYDAEVVEHSEAGVEVARLSATDGDSGNFGVVGYAISSPVDGQFSVDESGVVRLATGDLDREITSTVLLTVAAFDSGPVQGRHSATAQVNITVVDVNDQSPKFTRSLYTASIVEDIPLNSPSPILQVLAVDADDAVDGIVYSLLPGLYSAWFRLDSMSGFFYPAKPVSAQVPEMSLTVLASDGLHNDTASVLIRVTAANHDKPRFITPQRDNKIYYVLENLLEPGSLILTAEAADRDPGENGRISYYFRVQDEDLGSTDAFTIDPSSGQIRSRITFDRERQDRYTLVLVARDAGSPVRHESVRYVQVHVRDVDDHAAVFADPVYRFTHTENTPSGHTIGSVSAGDEDSDETGRTLYFAVGGDTDSLAVTKHGYVVNMVSIDRELKHQYELIVKATSNASFYASNVSAADMDATMTLVQVAILDENDSPPVFKQRQFYAGVSEDAQFKDNVISVVAEDLDAGKNAELVYTIRSSHIYKPGATESSGSIVPSPFSVDESGRLSCATLMGEYRHHRFLLELVAREAYPPMRQDTAHIHVWVYDDSQLVYILLGISPEQVQTQRERITQALSNVTGDRVVIDDVRYHLTEENVLRKTWSDVYLHVADDNQLVVSPDDILSALDSNNGYLQQHHGYMKLQQAQAVELGSAAAARQLTDATLVTLVALLLVLIVGLVTFCVCCCCLRNLAVTAPHHLIKKCHPPMPAVGSPTRLPSSPVVAAPAPATADVEDPAGTENPLWIDHKFKSYEEQELSMQVCHNYSGVRDDSNTAADDVQSNTYATIPQRPDSHMTLYGHADTEYATVEHRHPSTSALPAGPTIPGIVPCSLDPLPARPVGMDPNPFGDTNGGSAMGNVDFGNKSRLSIARDGLPELVAELR